MKEKYATKIHQAKSAFYGECNAGVSVFKKKRKLEAMDTCIKPDIIYNVLSIPRIEKYGP